jgi:putative endonuclease
MPKVFTSKKQKIGELGENLAERFLVKHGFNIIERNYTKKWGEIDIVAQKDRVLHFVEVKSVSRELDFVSPGLDSWRAEDNMHKWKLDRIKRTIQSYLLSKKNPTKNEWEVDLVVVYLDINNKKAKIKVVNNIII